MSEALLCVKVDAEGVGDMETRLLKGIRALLRLKGIRTLLRVQGI